MNDSFISHNKLGSKVIELRSQNPITIKLHKWFVSDVIDYVHNALSRLNYHSIDTPRLSKAIPFTTSSVFRMLPHHHGKPREGQGYVYPNVLSPNRKYYLRITALNSFMISTIHRLVYEGGGFGVGEKIVLGGYGFMIKDWYWNGEEHPYANNGTFMGSCLRFLGLKRLGENDIFTPQDFCNWRANFIPLPYLTSTIKFYLNSPCIIWDGKSYRPLKNKEQLFQRQLSGDKFIHDIVPENIIKGVKKFLKQFVHISYSQLTTSPMIIKQWEDFSPILGSVGQITLETDRVDRWEWAFLRMLASRNCYTGVGEESAWGFGQVSVDFGKYD